MTAAFDVVQVASLGPAFDARLAQRCRVLQTWHEPRGLAAFGTALPGIRLAVTSVRHGFTGGMFDALPDLKAVCSWGVGHDTLDLHEAARRGIGVSVTPDVLDDCVADLAWALLLSAARRTAAGDRYVKTGQWRALGQFPVTTRVSGKRLGILGLGRIGEAIARRATGFDMQVRYHNRSPRPDSPYGYAHSLVELADWADFLAVACVGGAATRHLVDAAVIRALGPRGILVNIARGSVVDQTAVLAALRSGELGGAGLDVLEREPTDAAEFADLDQVSLMPHVGSATHETRAAMADLVFDNVDSFLRTGALLTPVAAREMQA
ncbi:2-hydroxyacid dehydrogenase [Bordetella genomosp. 12]|uniref:Hydroxyacid dehydrogenase n=1 Tax=Bordetella genomosp. 12 TaxID=463035 RepID=A0A261VF91_9BORD|nr:2-hydroxyacid dehydrogenase [Bordetella genomosp. 12]OZI71823.1 hydroxyacid dehydrogenase [Bordetella genomosp. 12]